MLQIEVWPLRGLRLSGTIRAADVEPLIKAIQDHPEQGAVALHFEAVTEITTDAAVLLKDRLDALWDSGEAKRVMYLHVVPGEIADVLESAGFVEGTGWHELVYMTPEDG
jgi:hypothetical protein